MKKLSFLYATKTLSILLLTVFVVISCDNSTGHDDDHEQEPVGLRVKQFDNNVNGATVAEVQDGNATGSFAITNGSTSQFIVVFIDEDGEEFLPEIEEHTVDFTISEGQAQASALVPFSETEPFTFQIQGKNEGSAALVITLNHEGSAEFISPNIPIQVSANSN